MSSFSSSSTSPALCDFDANLLHKDLKETMEYHVNQARTHANVQLFVVPGSNLSDSEEALKLAKTAVTDLNTCVIATAGVHPYNTGTDIYNESTIEKLLSMIRDEPYSSTCMAVGETGLDYSDGFPDKELQKPWFRSHVQFAIEHQKPLFLHVREAKSDFLSILREYNFSDEGPPPIRCCVHCFTGTTEELRTYVQMGFYIGLTGYTINTIDAAEKAKVAGEIANPDDENPEDTIRDWLEIIPHDRLVIETDAPYMGFKGCRKTESKKKNQKYPNVPASLGSVCDFIAKMSGRTYDEVALTTTQNTMRFFGREE